MSKTCYMCDEISTSVEHVPPKCLFPEKKDLPEGEDLRKELITVPSCAIHNTSKSNDDEYLLYTLSFSVAGNNIADNQVATKIQRSIKKRSNLINKLNLNVEKLLIQNINTGEWFSGQTLDVDYERIRSCIDKIARGIYFHQFGEKWLEDISINIHFMLNIDPLHKKYNDKLSKMDKMSEQHLKDENGIGKNKEVFYYKFKENSDGLVMKLYFYGDNTVTILFDKNHTLTEA